MTRSHEQIFKMPEAATSAGYCSSCVERLCGAVAALPGVEATECDRVNGVMRVTHDPHVVSAAEIEAELHRVGLDISATVSHSSFRLTGLD